MPIADVRCKLSNLATLQGKNLSLDVDGGGGGSESAAHAMKFLILFVNTMGRLSFREAELRALLELSKCEHAPTCWTRENDPTGQDSVFMEVSPGKLCTYECFEPCVYRLICHPKK